VEDGRELMSDDVPKIVEFTVTSQFLFQRDKQCFDDGRITQRAVALIAVIAVEKSDTDEMECCHSLPLLML